MEPSPLYTVDEQVWASVVGTRPVLVHLLEGFVDAGHVARQLAEHLRETCQAEEMVTFDLDVVHDYRARRPPMTFDTNTWTGITEYRLAIDKLTDASGRTFLLLSGPEPDTVWNRMTQAVLGIASDLDVSMLVTAQGVPMGVPHTRPTLVTGHATDPELVKDNPVWIDRVTVPGSFSAVLEYRSGESGRLARGYVAHVPHYLAPGTYVPGAMAVLDRIRTDTGLDLPPGDLATLALQTLSTLESEVQADDELRPLVEALEKQYDELEEQGRGGVPSADEIGAALEEFLARREDGEPDDEAH